jgi:large subunit ribosomal protein L29
VSKQVEAVNSLRTMTTADLDEHLRQQRRRLFEVRFQQAAGQVENHRQVRELRREIARTMTIQLELAHGHHLVSDLEVEEEPEEQARPRGLLRRRQTAVPAGEVVDAELVDAGAAAAEPVADAGSDDAGAAEPEPVTKARRPRRDRVAAAPVAEAEPAVEPAGDEAVEDTETAGDGSEIADEGATGPDEEQTDE